MKTHENILSIVIVYGFFIFLVFIEEDLLWVERYLYGKHYYVSSSR